MLLLDVYKINIGVALAVTVGIIATSMFASLYSSRSVTSKKPK
jgi:hypothetical protein